MYIAPENLASVIMGNGLLPVGTEPKPEPMMIYQ